MRERITVGSANMFQQTSSSATASSYHNPKLTPVNAVSPNFEPKPNSSFLIRNELLQRQIALQLRYIAYRNYAEAVQMTSSTTSAVQAEPKEFGTADQQSLKAAMVQISAGKNYCQTAQSEGNRNISNFKSLTKCQQLQLANYAQTRRYQPYKTPSSLNAQNKEKWISRLIETGKNKKQTPTSNVCHTKFQSNSSEQSFKMLPKQCPTQLPPCEFNSLPQAGSLKLPTYHF